MIMIMINFLWLKAYYIYYRPQRCVGGHKFVKVAG